MTTDKDAQQFDQAISVSGLLGEQTRAHLVAAACLISAQQHVAAASQAELGANDSSNSAAISSPNRNTLH